MTPTGWMTRDGLHVALHDAGGSGRPVIFQHGLGGDAKQTAEAFPADPRFRRVTLACRGHGASEPGMDLSIATFASDVAVLAESLGTPLPIGGISMGAAIALRLAVTRPELVRALILVRPAWATEAGPANMVPVAEVAATMTRLPKGEDRVAYLGSEMARLLERDSPDNLASMTGYFDRTPRAETIRLLAAISADGPGVTEAEVRSLDVPTLVCGTPDDVIHPQGLARSLAAMIPNARYVDLPSKGRDKPAHLAALHAAITQFLLET